MNSMTGFGQAAVTAAGRRFVVEIRTVNSRGFEVKVRGRDVSAACEMEVVRAVKAAVARGSVLVGLRADTEVTAVEPTIDVERIRAIHAALDVLRRELGIEAPVDLATVAAFRGARLSGPEAAVEIVWDEVRPAVEDALRALAAERAREGLALAADVRARLQTLRVLVERIATQAAPLARKAAQRLEQRVAMLAGAVTIDPARLAQEVALLADKLDVSEELVRLETHLAHLATLLGAAGEPTGRKIDFVVQEIGREMNTIGSKVQDAEVAALVIDGKAELEKIREQAQNIE